MAVINISQLPAPQIVDVLDFEALLAERTVAFVALYPVDEHGARWRWRLNPSSVAAGKHLSRNPAAPAH